MTTKKLHVLLLVFIAFFGGYFFGVNKVNFEWKHLTPQVSIVNKEPSSHMSSVDFALFWSVWNKLNEKYYDKKVVDSQKMLDGAIMGMTQSLGDPYTMFLPPIENSSFQQQLANQFQGIGAELGLKDKQLIVIAPLDGSPAKKAGIQAGDAIFNVDGKSTDGLSLEQVVAKIRGPKGTQVVLDILHKGHKKMEKISITRDTIVVKSVVGWIKNIKDISNLSSSLIKSDKSGERIAYVRVSEFGDNTNQNWTAVVTAMQEDIMKHGSVKGLILDLRNNPGGYLTDATYIAGEFLPNNATVAIQDRGNDDTTTLRVARNGVLLDVPVLVLINKGSASASEIVSGALKDNKRALLVGDTSFGKGTVQEAIDLGHGAGLHVTIAKWLTPNGTWVHNKGLTPDIQVSLDEKDLNHDTQLEKAIQHLVE